MTPNPILKVLSILKKHKVRYLLIGGQACIIYGAAEFSRDSDFAILNSPTNLERLRKALKSLKAEPIYVPPLQVDYLERGHACHFRCGAKAVKDLRIDVISKLRGCAPFNKLWERKNTISLEWIGGINIIGLRDLVQCKKTQRDKDWLMLKRLVNSDIVLNKYKAPAERIRWWFEECRDSVVLIDLAKKYPKLAGKYLRMRPLISSAIAGDIQRLDRRLREEELAERIKDTEYWKPLKKELELLRRSIRK